MGVYARQHAQQLLIDVTPLGGPHPTISPRAHLLLLHIAQNFAGSENDRRDLKKKILWDPTQEYFEGLGKKAQAIGYNVPDDLDTRALAENPTLTQNMINTAKAAVNKAVKELLAAKFLYQAPDGSMRGRRGQTAIYKLPFLSSPCTTCEMNADGADGLMDPTLHIPQHVRDRLEGQADDWSHNMPSTKKVRAKRPNNSRFKEIMAANPPWGQEPSTPKEPSWGEPWGSE